MCVSFGGLIIVLYKKEGPAMKPYIPKDELALLHRALMPVLSKAAIGDFSSEVEIDPANSREVNEILMGVEVLLEVIREKIAAQEDAVAAAAEPHRAALLDEVLSERVD
jgi:hypothetical protein